MHAILWRDFLCPWCYLGRDRTSLMEELGVTVTPWSYELHPELPPSGRAVRPGGRYDRLLDHIALECEAVGLPFRKPDRSPNTRRALETAELVRLHHPAALGAFDDRCYRLHWVEGGDLGDPDELRRMLAEAGADADHVERLLAEGHGSAALGTSMAEAREHGVTAAPAWWVDDRLLVPGAQPRETVQRWVTKLAASTDN